MPEHIYKVLPNFPQVYLFIGNPGQHWKQSNITRNLSCFLSENSLINTTQVWTLKIIIEIHEYPHKVLQHFHWCTYSLGGPLIAHNIRLIFCTCIPLDNNRYIMQYLCKVISNHSNLEMLVVLTQDHSTWNNLIQFNSGQIFSISRNFFYKTIL